PLTYAGLRTLVSDIVMEISRYGIGAGDRVAIVLDNGPEMAAAFLSISAGATAAPLNPAYRADEFEFYLSDLQARLLVVPEKAEGPVLEVAERLGIAVAELRADPAEAAGRFSLVGRGIGGAPERPGFASVDET